MHETLNRELNIQFPGNRILKINHPKIFLESFLLKKIKLRWEAQHGTPAFHLTCPVATPAVRVQYHCFASLAPNFVTSHHCRNSLLKKGKLWPGFIPSSYLASPCWTSSIIACLHFLISISRVRVPVCVHMCVCVFISSLPPSEKQSSRLQFHSLRQGKKSVQRSSTLCNFPAKWILFNLSAWDGPRAPGQCWWMMF